MNLSDLILSDEEARHEEVNSTISTIQEEIKQSIEAKDLAREEYWRNVLTAVYALEDALIGDNIS